jgi:hypothetical protein
MTTAIAPRQGRGYGCRKDENPILVIRSIYRWLNIRFDYTGAV